MTQLLDYDYIAVKDYTAIAAEVAQKLAATAVERDRQAGLPEEEVQLIRDAGLIDLVIPREYGGAGGTWIDAYNVIRELSKADGSVGQLYSNHVTLCSVGQVSGTPAQAEQFYRVTAQNQLFWGNAINILDTRLKITPEGDRFWVDGVKSFGTGSAVSDLRVFSAVQDGVEFPILFVLPHDREGVTYNNDWDNMGQRRTASGSFTFNNVLVYPDEIIGPPPAPDSAFCTLIFLVVQLTKTYVYLGIAEGALEAAKAYTTTMTRPWMTSGVDRASKDPYILRNYGEMWAQLQAAIALANQAAQQVQVTWEKGDSLTHQERGELAIPIYAAKAMATKMGLDITTRIFEVMGARASSRKYGFDRYWRDLRTFTLHDPVDYKLQGIGNWFLNQEFPTPSPYS